MKTYPAEQDLTTVAASAHEKFVTISIDDGDDSDLRTVDLLHKYGLQATFYIPGSNEERQVMNARQIREIDQQFEIGSHTLHHVRLHNLPPQQAWQEIVDGKKFSEDAVGHEVVSFCYPGGKFTRQVARQVADAGFLGARTCRYFQNNFPNDPFFWDISTYANSYPSYVQLRHCLLEYNFGGAYKYLTTFRAEVPWVSQFKRALEDVSQNAGIAHLYFHSWEIGENNEWGELESVFKAIADYRLTPVTNGFLYRRWHEKHATANQELEHHVPRVSG